MGFEIEGKFAWAKSVIQFLVEYQGPEELPLPTDEMRRVRKRQQQISQKFSTNSKQS